jgi:hypothetical protein
MNRKHQEREKQCERDPEVSGQGEERIQGTECSFSLKKNVSREPESGTV